MALERLIAAEAANKLEDMGELTAEKHTQEYEECYRGK